MICHCACRCSGNTGKNNLTKGHHVDDWIDERNMKLGRNTLCITYLWYQTIRTFSGKKSKLSKHWNKHNQTSQIYENINIRNQKDIRLLIIIDYCNEPFVNFYLVNIYNEKQIKSSTTKTKTNLHCFIKPSSK